MSFSERWYPHYEWAFRNANLCIIGVDNNIVRRGAGELSVYWGKPLLAHLSTLAWGGRFTSRSPWRESCRFCFFSRADEGSSTGSWAIAPSQYAPVAVRGPR